MTARGLNSRRDNPIERDAQTSARDLLRLLVAVAGVAPAFVVAAVVGSGVSEMVAAGGAVPRVAIWAALWPVLSFAWVVTVLHGRAVLSRRPAQLREALVVLVAGAGAAAAAAVGVIGWAEARFGTWDAESTNISTWLPFATAVVGLALACRWITSSWTRSFFETVGVVMAVVVLAIALSNLRGVLDGLSPAAPLLAIGILAPAAIAVAAVTVAARRVRRTGKVTQL